MAMPLARTGVCTVLWSNVLLASAVFSDHIARPSSPVLRMKLFDSDRVRHAGVEVEPVGDLVDDDVVGDLQVVHRAVEPHAHLGVVDVEAVDRSSC